MLWCQLKFSSLKLYQHSVLYFLSAAWHASSRRWVITYGGPICLFPCPYALIWFIGFIIIFDFGTHLCFWGKLSSFTTPFGKHGRVSCHLIAISFTEVFLCRYHTASFFVCISVFQKDIKPCGWKKIFLNNIFIPKATLSNRASTWNAEEFTTQKAWVTLILALDFNQKPHIFQPSALEVGPVLSHSLW